MGRIGYCLGGQMLKMLRQCLLAAAALFLTLGLAPTSAHAYEVTPLRVILQPSAGNRAATVSVNNVRDEDLFIEVKTFRRQVARDGTQTLEPVDDKFLVYPPQRQIEPKTTQAIRIQFVGPAPVDQSESYVVQIVEVPVDKPGFSGIRYTYNFGVAVYVDAPNARPSLSIAGGTVNDGLLNFTVRNDGPGYGFTVGHALQFTAGGAQQTVEPGPLAELVAMPLIPPFSERQFSLAIPNLADGPVTDISLIDRTE